MILKFEESFQLVCIACHFGMYTLKDLSNDIWRAHQSGKLVGDEENNIPPYYTRGIMNHTIMYMAEDVFLFSALGNFNSRIIVSQCRSSLCT